MTETTETPAARPPGRPRSARAEKAIMAATLDLLAEEAGVAGVSIEAVAARAGVGKTTIYRRWPNKEALIVEALAAAKAPLPEPGGRSAREDLLAMARVLATEQGARHGRCFWNVMGSAEKHPELFARYRREVVEPRRESVRALLRRGIESGELRPDLDPDVVMSMLFGAMSMQARAMAPPGGFPADRPDKIVDTILRGVATHR